MRDGRERLKRSKGRRWRYRRMENVNAVMAKVLRFVSLAEWTRRR